MRISKVGALALCGVAILTMGAKKNSRITADEANKIVVTARITDPNGAVPDVQANDFNFNVWMEGNCPADAQCGWGERVQNADGTVTVTLERGDNDPPLQGATYAVQAQFFSGPADLTPSDTLRQFMEPGKTYDVGTIKLSKPVVRGTVVDPTGAVMTSGNVNLRSKDWVVNLWGGVNSDGTFKIGGKVDAGVYFLDVQASQDSNYADSTYEVTIADPSVTLDLGQKALSTPYLIGTVVRPDGSPLNADPENCSSSEEGCLQANVNVYTKDYSSSKWKQTDNAGKFKFGSFSTGAYLVKVDPPWRSKFTGIPEQSVDLVENTLKDLGTLALTSPQITGVVYAPDGKTPVANGGVRVRTEDWKVDRWGNADENGVYYIGGITKTGTYLLSLDTNWEHPEYVPKEPKKITISDLNGLITENLQYTKATKTIIGKVTRANGEGVVAEVNAWPEGGGNGVNKTSAADGSFTLLVGGGNWRVRPNVPWQSQDSVDWSYTGNDHVVTFVQDETTETATENFQVTTTDAQITGRLLDPDGKPMTDANVNANTDNGTWFNAQVKSGGKFTLKVVGGTYRVSAWTSNTELSFPEKIITVNSGETVNMGDLQAISKDARINGVLTTEDNKPIAGMRINAFMFGAPGWSEGTTLEDGSFALPVFAGRWGLQFNQNSDSRYVYDGKQIEVQVESDEDIVNVGTIKLTFADVGISGQILDSSTKKTIPNFCSWVYGRPIADKVIGDKRDGPQKEYGGSVDCQTGKFSFFVPSKVASSLALGTHVGPDTPYSLEKEVTLPITADKNYTVNILLVKNDATFFGKLVSTAGTPLTNCDFQGDVYFNEVETGIWHGGRIQTDCSYQVTLLGGREYHYGYWTNDRTRFLEQPPQDNTITINKEERKEMNFPVMVADAFITGIVVDYSGKPVSHVNVNIGNWREVDAILEKTKKGMSEEERQAEHRRLEIHNWAETDKTGRFKIGAAINHTYDLNVWFPPEQSQLKNLVQPDNLEIKLITPVQEVTVKLEKALGEMSGSVRLNKVPVSSAWMWCWNEEGGHMGTDTNEKGMYSVAYKPGRWHCGADSFIDGVSYRTPNETIIDITNQPSIKQDFLMKASEFEVPPAVSVQFDPTQSQAISLDNGTTINIPANALGTDNTKLVTVNAEPTVSFQRSQFVQPFGIGYELKALDDTSTPIVKFNSNVQISFFYTDDQLNALGVDEATLSASYQNESNGNWQNVEGGTVIDTDQNKVTVSTNHFSKFAMTSGASKKSKAKTKKKKTVSILSSQTNLMITPKSAGAPELTIYDNRGKEVSSFFAYPSAWRMGVKAWAADLDQNGKTEIVTVPEVGSPALVRVFDTKGKVLGQFNAYDASYRGGVNVAVADVHKDKGLEIITVPAGGSANVKVFSSSGKLKKEWNAYVSGYTKGALIAAADLNADGKTEIVTAPMESSSQIRVFDGNGSVKGQWNAFDAGQAAANKGIASLLLVDTDKDGKLEVIASSRGGAALVRIFNSSGKTKSTITAFDASLADGAIVKAGDVDGDGKVDLVAMPEADGRALVRNFDTAGKLKTQFYAFDPKVLPKGTYEFVLGNADGKGADEIVVAPGKGLGPQAKMFDVRGKTLGQWMVFDAAFRGGVNLTTIPK